MIDELNLVKNAVKGDKRALEVLIKTYDRRIFGLLLNILKNHDDACDAYQNTFIKVHKYIRNFKFEANFYTWLYRIAVNTAYTHYKKRQGEQGKVFSEDFSEIEHIYNPETEDDDDFFGTDKKNIVKECVDKLSFQQKSVVYLKSYEGKKFKEIADILSLNEGTVKKYFHRAVQNIKSKVSEKQQNMR